MSYKVIVKGKGFESFSKAFRDGYIRPLDEIWIGMVPKERYEFIGARNEVLGAITDPVMANTYDLEKLIGKKICKVKRYVNAENKT
jgi:hypothetical protein